MEVPPAGWRSGERVDLEVVWFGRRRRAQGALRALAGASWPAAGGAPEVGAAVRVPGVAVERALWWALDHLRDAEILSPRWLRGLIALELQARARQYQR